MVASGQPHLIPLSFLHFSLIAVFSCCSPPLLTQMFCWCYLVYVHTKVFLPSSKMEILSPLSMPTKVVVEKCTQLSQSFINKDGSEALILEGLTPSTTLSKTPGEYHYLPASLTTTTQLPHTSSASFTSSLEKRVQPDSLAYWKEGLIVHAA